MSIFLEQRLENQLKITPQLVIANELLAMPSADLEQAIAQEQEENPALELVENERCRICGSPLQSKHCPYCLNRKPSQGARDDHEGWNYQDYRSYRSDDEDDTDPISRIPHGPSLSEYLMWQLRPVLPPEEHELARYVIDCLDSHGFLVVASEEIARAQKASAEQVERVVSELQRSEPFGIGARTPQESLLIQAQCLREQGAGVHPLCEPALEHWELFLKRQYHALSRELGVSEEDVEEAYEFIQRNLNPYPAHAHWSLGESHPSPDAVYVRPDIAIRRRPAPDEGFEVEVLPAHSYSLRIDATYSGLAKQLEQESQPQNQEACRQLKEYIARGNLFIRCVNQRWQTLQKIGGWLVNYQSDFLQHGEKAIKPITRAELAEQIGVHESTVSRAVANKYVLLPDGRVIPMSDFFDDSLAAKEVLKEIIQRETRPMSDQELAKHLADNGFPIARRTVAKYRQELDILPARLRSS